MNKSELRGLSSLSLSLPLLLLLLMLALGHAAHNVYVYNGPGASLVHVKHTLLMLQSVLPSTEFSMSTISPSQLVDGGWEADCALIVMPGGADIPYTQQLNGEGNRRIRAFVEAGGSYLGLCAGAYYAGNYVDFAKGTPLEVEGERELALFPGVVRGPNLAPYDYASNSGVRDAVVDWLGTPTPHHTYHIFYNGGGYFVDADGPDMQAKGVEVLARYNLTETERDGQDEVAVVQCRVGAGLAVLSGVHFEVDPTLLDTSDPYLGSVAPVLLKTNQQRQVLVNYIVNLLVNRGSNLIPKPRL